MFNPDKKQMSTVKQAVEQSELDPMSANHYDEANLYTFYSSPDSDWSEEWLEKRQQIEKDLGISILGQGRDSLVFTAPDIPDRFVVSFSYEYDPYSEDRLSSLEHVADIKVRYYINKILHTLFPQNIAKIHYSSFDPDDVGEITVRQKIKTVHDYLRSESDPWVAGELEKGNESPYTLNDIEMLIETHRLPAKLDRININNTITDIHGNEYYVDADFARAVDYRNQLTSSLRLDRDFITSLHAFTDFMDTHDYTDSQKAQVAKSIDRLKKLYFEYKKEADALF